MPQIVQNVHQMIVLILAQLDFASGSGEKEPRLTIQ